jgi:hypothetical protein
MANLVIPENNTTSNLTTQAGAAFLPELWKRGVKLSEAAENFFEQFEGPTESYAVQSIRDLSRGAGSKITFRTMTHLYGEGVQGDNLINDKTEDFRVGQFNLEVDFLRHAVSYNRRTEERTALASELKNNVPVLLGNWLGRIKTERLFKLFQHKGGALNYVNINNRSSIDDIKTSDTLGYASIINNGQVLRTRGAKPAQIGTVGKNKVHKFHVIGTGEGFLALKDESKYLDAVKAYTTNVGESSVLFTGGYVDLDGHVIKEYNPIDHDGYGPVGSPLNPKAFLGETFTIDNSTQNSASITVKGGGTGYANAPTNAKANLFFKYFSNYAYTFNATATGSYAAPTSAGVVGSVSPRSGGKGYILILSAGKYGFYEYSTNDGNKLTLTGALVKTTGGPTAGTFNKVRATWQLNATSFADANITNTHSVGDVIVECNSKGVPIGRTLFLGANAAVRGYGSLDGERSEETFDGDFVRKVYITSIFGQAPYERPDGIQPNYLVLSHAISLPGLTLPNSEAP